MKNPLKAISAKLNNIIKVAENQRRIMRNINLLRGSDVVKGNAYLAKIFDYLTHDDTDMLNSIDESRVVTRKLDICHIFATSNNNVIGMNGVLPWHSSRDLAYFRSATVGHVLIMGSTTFRNMPQLKDRLVIVIGRSEETRAKIEGYDNYYLVPNIEAAYVKANILLNEHPELPNRIMIVGGRLIYKLTAKDVTHVYHNRINVTVPESEKEITYFDWAYPSDPNIVFINSTFEGSII